MLIDKIRSKPAVVLGGVALLAVAIIFLRLSPTNAETTSPARGNKAESFGVIEAVTSTRPALIDPAKYQFPVTLSNSRWKSLLDANQYYILRERGTEPAFTGKYDHNDIAGIYYSAATGQPLFSSKDKFDSGTGWPSFTRPIDPSAVLLAVDNSQFMHRIEVEDSLSGSHLGHVFDDGPPPTGKRYCIDSAALIFVPTGGTPPRIMAPNNPKAAGSGSILPTVADRRSNG